MRGQILAELVNYKDRMLPFMPGQRTADKKRAFFPIFSTMIGATEIARMLPEPAMREKVLASASRLRKGRSGSSLFMPFIATRAFGKTPIASIQIASLPIARRSQTVSSTCRLGLGRGSASVHRSQ
jgi:hypothetical protein